jgi:hypothetical protein
MASIASSQAIHLNQPMLLASSYCIQTRLFEFISLFSYSPQPFRSVYRLEASAFKRSNRLFVSVESPIRLNLSDSNFSFHLIRSSQLLRSHLKPLFYSNRSASLSLFQSRPLILFIDVHSNLAYLNSVSSQAFQFTNSNRPLV